MSYTPAQVGAAVDTSRGRSTTAPDPMGRVDYTGDEFDSTPPSLGATRAFRLAGAAADMDGPATDTEGAALAREHASVGHSDARHAEIDTVGAPYGPEDPSLKAQGELVSNTRTPVQMVPQDPPTRPSAGFTGADPARPAMTPRWLFMRLFDKWAADHPGVVEKVPQPAPHAAVPFAWPQDVPGALPSPVGGFHNRREGVGSQPNSFRLMPRPWDELLVNTNAAAGAGGANAAAAAQARRGWRLG